MPLDRAVTEVNALTEALDYRNTVWQRVALALGWRTWDVGAENEEHELIKTEAKQERKDAKAKEKLEYKAYLRKVGLEMSSKESNVYRGLKSAKLKKEYILKIGKEKGIK